MIIDLRGANGAGKTMAVRGLIALADADLSLKGPGILAADWAIKPDTTWAHQLTFQSLGRPVYIVGPYDGESVSGGADKIRSFDEITARIEYLGRHGHVVFEGAIIGQSFERFHLTAQKFPGEYMCALLDTTLEECMDRIRGRREARGADPDDFKEALVAEKYKRVLVAGRKFADAGIPVTTIPGSGGAEVPGQALLTLLGGGQLGLGL